MQHGCQPGSKSGRCATSRWRRQTARCSGSWLRRALPLWPPNPASRRQATTSWRRATRRGRRRQRRRLRRRRRRRWCEKRGALRQDNTKQEPPPGVSHHDVLLSRADRLLGEETLSITSPRSSPAPAAASSSSSIDPILDHLSTRSCWAAAAVAPPPARSTTCTFTIYCRS